MTKTCTWAVGKVDLYLAPVDLGLLTRPRLEAPLGQRSQLCLGAQRPHGIPHRVVAAGVAAHRAQFLIQDAGRVVDPRGALLEPSQVRVEQLRRAWTASVGRPFGLLQPAPDRLARQPHLPGDRREVLPSGLEPQPLFPLLLADHLHLPVLCQFGHGSGGTGDGVGLQADTANTTSFPSILMLLSKTDRDNY